MFLLPVDSPLVPLLLFFFWNFSESRQQAVLQMFQQQRLTLDSQVLLVHTYIFFTLALF